jgi:hypothetical protein
VTLIGLTLLLASCLTSPKPTLPSIGLDWPALPDPTGKVLYIDEETCGVAGGMVVMPLEYWLALGRYVVDVERVRKQVEILYGEEP